MADKFTQAILDGLTRAASESGGLPLFASRSEAGLFPSAAAVKPAAQKCLAEGYLKVVRTEPRGKSACDFYALTDAGWEFLLTHVNPKQVLEDFVRVLESRQGEVDRLIAVATRMAESLDGLKEAVTRVLPQVTTGKLIQPNPPAPFPKREGGESDLWSEPDRSSSRSPSPLRGGAGGGVLHMNGTATLEAPATELAGAVLARLSDWVASAGASEDCPLPELFRSLSTREPAPTVGEFHDCLRSLHQAGKVYLHPWTGPLYALPEPTYALLVGHNVAYYASVR